MLARRVIPIIVLLLLVAAGVGWFIWGPHRRAPDRMLEIAAARGLVLEGGTKQAGWFSTTWRDARLSLRDLPGLAVEIGQVHVQHWPFQTPRVTVTRARVHLSGEPAPLLAAIRPALRSDLGDLVVADLDVTYEHRVLGRIVFARVTPELTGSSLVLAAKQVRVGRFAWSDVRLVVAPRKDMVVIGWGGELEPARLQLSCFPPAGNASRWLLSVQRQPARPLLGLLGFDLGKALEHARVAGKLSLEVPDDAGGSPKGHVQLVFDDWPLGAPEGAQTMLGNTVSLLTNLVPAGDGVHWLLPRVELTLPVFSLVGQGHVQLGGRPGLVIEAEGTRSCRELRALLPPSVERDQVRQFLDAQPVPSPKASGGEILPAWVELRVSAGAGAGYHPQWRYRPACGLPAWGEASKQAAAENRAAAEGDPL